MEVLEIIAAKRNLARRVQQDLVDNFRKMEDAQRLEKSNTILDEVNSYLQIEENLIFPFIRRQGRQEDLIERVRLIHQEIETLTEHAIMMHVDEPSGEYWKDMIALGELLDRAKQADEDILFPWAKAYLSDEDQYYIATHLKEQMTHESLPSSGMTIY
jgi:hypothetical protein